MINAEAQNRKYRRRRCWIRIGWYFVATALFVCAILELISTAVYIPWIHLSSLLLFGLCAFVAAILASDEALFYSLMIFIYRHIIRRRNQKERARNDN